MHIHHIFTDPRIIFLFLILFAESSWQMCGMNDYIMDKEIKDNLIRWLSSCVDLLLPRTCIVCGRKLLPDEKHLCLHCRMDLPLTHFWKRTHNPMADKFNLLIQKELEQGWDAGHCREERYAYACALFFYSTDAGYIRITRGLKYKGDIPSGTYFGRMLGRQMATSTHFSDVGIVIPVPLHWRRRWERGYNQAEVIAAEVARELGAELRCDILERVRSTMTQTKMSVEDKSTNVRGAFKVKDRKCLLQMTDGGHILLLDDVFTTGATLHACYLALREVLPMHVRISVATLGFVGR